MRDGGIFRPGLRKETHSLELKDLRRPEAVRLWRVLDFKVQIRSGQPCDEWEVAGTAQHSCASNR
jgi:hypothetical protein